MISIYCKMNLFYFIILTIFCYLDDIKLKLFGCDVLSEKQFFEVCDANIVYLCFFKNENAAIECYGIGVVRGFDQIHRKIYLITSVNREIIKIINCLYVCNISLPNSVILNEGPKIKGAIPFAYNTKDCNISKPFKNYNNNA